MALEKDVIINPTDEFTLTIQGTSKTKTVTYYTLFKKILGNITFPEVLPEEDTLDTVTNRGNTTFNTISVGGVTTNYTLYNTTYVAALQEGMMAWNSTDGTLDLRLLGNNVTLQIGQEQVVRVVNKTGVDLLEANYQAVKITGAQGNRLKVGLARADNDANSADTIGLVTETITNNQEGFVTSSGLVRGIDTTGALQGETWADGDVVYLSPTTFGAITNVKPLAPQHTVIMGFVVRAHGTQGQIYVKVDNGYEIDELHNVRITSVANNDTLLYDSTLSVWKNLPISSVAATLAFSTIAVTGSSTIVADSTSDTLTVTAGTGITLAGNATTDTLTITNNDRGSSQSIFKNIAVAGQTTVVADNNNDTFTLIAGANVTITTDAVNDTITINSTGGGGGASGTVTYIDVVGGTGISTSGGPVTTTGTITVDNTDKGSDQFIFKNVAVSGQSDIVADSNNDTLNVAAGTGISLATNATTDTLTITNSAPDQVVTLSSGTGISVTGAYPSFTVTNTDRGSSQNIFKNIAVAGQNTIVADSNNDTLTAVAGTGITITTNDTTDTLTVTNSAPDQVVSITGAGTSVVTGTYPNFTVTSADQYVGTVTSVNLTAGTGMSVSGGPVTTSGSITVTNTDPGSAQNIFKNFAVAGEPTIVADSNNDTFTTAAGTGITLTTNATTDTLTITNSAPDQVVSISAGTGISASGTYPNFTVTNTAPDQIVVLNAGTGISTSGTYPNFTVTNSAPDQVVSITGAGTSVVTGTYPNFTVTSNDQFVGTVTSVGLTAGTGMSVSGGPITSSGSITVTNSDRGSSQNIFKNVAVPGETTIVASSNNDTFTIKPGSGISATTLGNDITISNTDPGSAQNIFKNVAVSGQSTVVADSNNDTLTLVAGTNVTITTDATTDSVTINASIPTSATPADAEYARDYAAPFVVPATWAMVVLNGTNIRVGVNKDLSADNRGYFIVTFEVASTTVGPAFKFFKYKLYNASTTTDVVDSESYWVGYMYGTSEVPYTTFSFHIPSADAGVDTGDTIELHVQEISAGNAPDITYAALSYIDAIG